MTLDDSSNKLSRGHSLVPETSTGVKERLVPAVRYELFSFMNVHVISSARWRYNPPAVTREFSLALRLQESDRLKGIIQLLLAAATSSLCRFSPRAMIESSSSADALNFYGTFIFSGTETESTREGCLVEAVQFALRFTGVMFEKSVSHF